MTVYLVVKSYAPQFSKELWKVVTWNLMIMIAAIDNYETGLPVDNSYAQI